MMMTCLGAWGTEREKANKKNTMTTRMKACNGGEYDGGNDAVDDDNNKGDDAYGDDNRTKANQT